MIESSEEEEHGADRWTEPPSRFAEHQNGSDEYVEETEEELEDSRAVQQRHQQRKRDQFNFKLLMSSKWSKKLKPASRIAIRDFTTGGRKGQFETVDLAIGYLRDQLEEQISDLCANFQRNLNRIAKGIPPIIEPKHEEEAIDFSQISGVSKEPPGASVFGRSLLLQRITKLFHDQCSEKINTLQAVEEAVPPPIESEEMLLELFENRSLSGEEEETDSYYEGMSEDSEQDGAVEDRSYDDGNDEDHDAASY